MIYRFGIGCAVKILHYILSTCKVNIYGLDHFLQTIGNTPALLAIWHNRLAITPYALGPYLSQSKKIFAVISNNEDGNWVDALIHRYPNGHSIRVDHRRKTQAIQEMITALQEERNLVVVTPDGSRGPKEMVKNGIIAAAKQTGYPIVPLTWEGPCWKFSSWDHFRIPKPFSEINIYYLHPLYLKEKSSTDDDKKKLEELLNLR